MKEVNIWTDGSALKDPRGEDTFFGGAGAVLIYNGKQRQISIPIEGGTNNIAELSAPLFALRCLTERCKVKIMSDSQYTINCITKWRFGWERKGWINTKREPVKNKEIIQALITECGKHEVEWVKVKAHCGIPENELADQLAVAASTKLKEESLNECK